jgi:hypothetical protein
MLGGLPQVQLSTLQFSGAILKPTFVKQCPYSEFIGGAIKYVSLL